MFAISFCMHKGHAGSYRKFTLILNGYFCNWHMHRKKMSRPVNEKARSLLYKANRNKDFLPISVHFQTSDSIRKKVRKTYTTTIYKTSCFWNEGGMYESLKKHTHIIYII